MFRTPIGTVHNNKWPRIGPQYFHSFDNHLGPFRRHGLHWECSKRPLNHIRPRFGRSLCQRNTVTWIQAGCKYRLDKNIHRWQRFDMHAYSLISILQDSQSSNTLCTEHCGESSTPQLSSEQKNVLYQGSLMFTKWQRLNGGSDALDSHSYSLSLFL